MPSHSFIGVIPPVITPFRENGDVDFDSFGRNIERWNKSPLSGYLVLGSNSETPYLTEEEKLTLIEMTVRSAASGRTILAGTGLESTRDTIILTNKAARLGAHAALVLTPFYYGSQMTHASLIAHFTAIADAADIPILIYNVPKFTHVNLSADVAKTLSQHPNIVGMKDSAGDVSQLKVFKNAVPGNFSLLVGSGSVLYEALTLGINGAILAIANCMPMHCVEIQRYVEHGKADAARMLQELIRPVNKAVTETYGIAGLKYACTLLGYEGGYPRRPLLPLTPEHEQAIRSILAAAKLLDE